MEFLDELEVIEKLRMFYKSDIFEKMSGTEGSELTSQDRQKYEYTKIFNDKKIVNSIEQIRKDLSEVSSISDVSGLPQLFQISIYGSDRQEGSNAAFGDIEFKSDRSDELNSSNYVDSLLENATDTEDSITIPATSGLMLVKVKSAEIHPAYHSTEASEVFLNYIPTIERSRCTPEFSVDVFTRGTFSGVADDTGISTTETADIITDSLSTLKSAPNLVALRFLNDYDSVSKDGEDMMSFTSADGLMTLASTDMFGGTTTKQGEVDDKGKFQPDRYEQSGSADIVTYDDIIKQPYTMQRNGMEMFTMPQSLISKKKGVNIDPFRPFMSIKSATINTQSAGQGIISWNTAELVVEVYDRHRLNDIAFFLDPGQYAFTKFELTVGWRHQDSTSPYGQYINRMKSKELYALKSSSYTFNDAGVVTINLSLAMSGGQEISNSSMFAAGADGKGVREAHAALINDLQTIRAGTTSINSQRRTGNLLPTSIVTQENSADAMILDGPALARVRAASTQGEMTEDERSEFTGALSRLQGGKLTDYYTMLEAYVAKFLEDCGLPRGTRESLVFTRSGDPYPYRYTSDDKWETKDPPDSQEWSDLSAAGIAIVEPEFRDNINEQRTGEESGAEVRHVRFDKLFINAIVKRLLHGTEPTASEVHVFIYEFNNKCPTIGGQYMGDFKINADTIREKFKKVIKETQNLTIASFTSVIKSEMKDKLNSEFNIVTDEDRNEISTARESIETFNTDLRALISNRAETATRLSQSTGDTAQTRHQADLDKIDENIDKKNKEISDKQDEITKIMEDSVNAAQVGLRTAKIEMPDLKILIESKRSQDGKNIIRLHIYDGKSKPNELQTFLSNLNNDFSIPIAETPDATESVRTALLAELFDKGLLTTRESIDEFGTKRIRYVVNTQSHAIKSTIKNTMPSITYGIEGTAINKASMSMVSDANIQAHFLLQTQNENATNTLNNQSGSSQEDAQKIMPANISLDMMGCPLLRYGQEYFVDFDTNTDLDNVYAMTKITHSISPGVFKTTAQLKPTFKGSVSFSGLLNDIDFLQQPDNDVTTTPAAEQ